MPTDDTLTYLQTPPRRPNLGDLGGGLYEQDAEGPLAGDPDALAFNQSDKLLVHAHELIDAGKIYVLNPGTPAIDSVWPTILVAADFSVVDGGTGITEITHTGGKISVEQWPAKAYRVGNAGAGSATVEKITNGWRVRTYVATSLTDLAFVLEFSGI